MNNKNNNIFLPLKRCSLILIISFIVCSCKDKITFLNVGEGHCTLVNKEGCVPLLIDAGSRKRFDREVQLQPITPSPIEQEQYVVQKLTEAITSYWTLPDCNLNIILTHGDHDHISYVSSLLDKLRFNNGSFNCQILLGGKREHYDNDFLNSLRIHLNPTLPEHEGDKLYYSSSFAGRILEGNDLGFLNNSGCIKHLFCPQGKEGTNSKVKNSWSVITRIKLKSHQKKFSALLTGDADIATQAAHLRVLGNTRHKQLKSNVLLYPHHGAAPLHQPWIRAVDPEVVVISAGRYGGKASHPKAEAIRSLFWEGEAQPSDVNTIEGLSIRLKDLQLNNYDRHERIWNFVDPHKVIYYGNQNSYDNIQRRLARNGYRQFRFEDDAWYTNLGVTIGDSWHCALVDFPIYTLYSSGTLSFEFNSLSFFPHNYKINFIDNPSETDLMVRWVYDNAIKEEEDFDAFYQLPHQVKRAIYSSLAQALTTQNLTRERAESIFFLSFVIIPRVETESNNEQAIKTYRERKLLKLLNFFLDRTSNLDFNNVQDVDFFNEVIDVLFADARYYEDIKDITLFKQRKFLFDAFFTGPHLQEKEQRSDLFDLYYMVYSILKDFRNKITTEYLQRLVESLRVIPKDDMKERLCQIVDIYNTCNTGEKEYYQLNLAYLAPLLHLIYKHNLSESDLNTIEEVLSVLPDCFNVPVHETVAWLIPKLNNALRDIEDFNPITELFRNYLLRNPPTNHLIILERCIAKCM